MIYIGADHAGFEVKKKIINFFAENGIEYIDVTDYEIDEFDDYPDIAINICKEVLKSSENLGIAICGSGLGICVACNKIKGIIATFGYNKYLAKMARQHNNANVICLGGKLESEKTDEIFEIINTFLNEDFLEGRHKRRIDKIKKLEDSFGDRIWD